MKVLIYLYPGVTLLDAIGPYEALRHVEGAEIKFAAKKRGAVASDSKMASLYASVSIKEIKNAEILIIPGSTISYITEAKDKKVLDWIKMVDQSSHTTVSVGSGSILLAAAGLLEGREATSHWHALPLLEEYKVTPATDRFVEQGKYITAAGGSGGIDMALYLINLLKGDTVAKAAQLAMQYDPAPLFSAGNPESAGEEVLAMVSQQMEAGTQRDLSWWQKIRNRKTLKKLNK